MAKDVHFETAAAAALRGDASISDVISPIFVSSTYQPAATGQADTEHIYSRRSNPMRAMLEQTLTELEQGCGAAAFASGSAAIVVALLALDRGDHVIAPADVFFITRRNLEETFKRLGILDVSYIDLSDIRQIKASLTNRTKLVFVEEPTNPMLQRVDIAAIRSGLGSHPCLLACDNTVLTPFFQKPLLLGADIVIHSTTKYLSGHGDVVGGAIVWREESIYTKRVRSLQGDLGAVPSPIDCWLTLRGIQTLPQRMRHQSISASAIVKFLVNHPSVRRVHYPGLRPGADNDVRPLGGLVSFEVRGTEADAIAITHRTKLFKRATSFGLTCSLIEHRATTEGEMAKFPKTLIRLAVGLEHHDDLISDLASALLGDTS